MKLSVAYRDVTELRDIAFYGDSVVKLYPVREVSFPAFIERLIVIAEKIVVSVVGTYSFQLCFCSVFHLFATI